MPMQVELVSPERVLYEDDADMVIARTVGGGDIAFLTGHAPFLGALAIVLSLVLLAVSLAILIGLRDRWLGEP